MAKRINVMIENHTQIESAIDRLVDNPDARLDYIERSLPGAVIEHLLSRLRAARSPEAKRVVQAARQWVAHLDARINARINAEDPDVEQSNLRKQDLYHEKMEICDAVDALNKTEAHRDTRLS